MGSPARLAHSLRVSQLRLIAAIDRHRQIGSAAQMLGITQPAASRSLAEIERMAGVPLFDRHPRGMTPTPAGEVFARRAQAMLTGLTDLDRELDELQGGLTGIVRVGAVTGPALACVVPALRRLKAAAPRVEVAVEVEPSARLLAGLEDGSLDFLLARLPADRPALDRAAHLRIEPALREIVRCLVRAGHPLAGRRALGMAEIAAYPWVLQDRGAPIRAAVEQALWDDGLAPPANVTASASQMLALAMAVESDAICPMSHEVARLFQTLGGGGLTTLDLARPIQLAPCHLVSMASRQLSPAATRLMSLIRDEIAGQVAGEGS